MANKKEITPDTLLYLVHKLETTMTAADPKTMQAFKVPIHGCFGVLCVYDNLKDAEEAADGKYAVSIIKPTLNKNKEDGTKQETDSEGIR
jgi:hypothetical protein